MPGRGGGRQWTQGLPPIARQVIRDMTTERYRGMNASTGRWWIRMAPTTGPAQDVQLLLKTDQGALIDSWTVMVKGRLLSPFNGDGEPPRPSVRPMSDRGYRPDLKQGLGVVNEQTKAH